MDYSKNKTELMVVIHSYQVLTMLTKLKAEEGKVFSHPQLLKYGDLHCSYEFSHVVMNFS